MIDGVPAEWIITFVGKERNFEGCEVPASVVYSSRRQGGEHCYSKKGEWWCHRRYDVATTTVEE
jgi:hypothetical protein